MHLRFLEELLRAGKLKIGNKNENMAVHHPCKVIHNDEVGDMDRLLSVAGIQGRRPRTAPTFRDAVVAAAAASCGTRRPTWAASGFDQLKDTGQSTIVNRMSGLSPDAERRARRGDENHRCGHRARKATRGLTRDGRGGGPGPAVEAL